MTVTITREHPATGDAAALILELETHLGTLYPAASRHGYSVETLVARDVAFFLLRTEGAPAGCGGIEFTEAGCAELKRMFVRPSYRGRGFGKLLLHHLTALARSSGVRLLRLETGIHQKEAIAMYEAAGFHRIPPFSPYQEDPVSRCYEKQL